jgi:hypothetical protein
MVVLNRFSQIVDTEEVDADGVEPKPGRAISGIEAARRREAPLLAKHGEFARMLGLKRQNGTAYRH